MHHDNRFTIRSEFLQEIYNCAFGGSINALKGFIHQVNCRILNECTCEKNTLLLSTGELTDLPSRIAFHTNLLQCAHCQFPLLLSRSPYPSKRAVASHHDDIQNIRRKIPINGASLWDIADNPTLCLIRFVIN